MPAVGPRTLTGETIHSTKYRIPGESFKDAMTRIAAGLKDSARHFQEFREILIHQRFMPGGRIQLAIGSSAATTPYNCYVSGPIADSFVSGDGSICQRLTEAATTMRMGGGIGYDFSTLRPRGDLIRQLKSSASGPLSFMRMFDAMGQTVASAGHRRGAQMGVLRIDHPDVEEFIRAKQPSPQHQQLWEEITDALGPEKGAAARRMLSDSVPLQGFNLSVGVTNEFMECLASGKPFTLKFEGRPYREIDPFPLWEQLMRSAWDWAEPGVLFLDTINSMNNLWYCEKIAATNPCGEQPLPPHGACLLGSFNLVAYIHQDDAGKRYFNMTQFWADVEPVVRAMDRVPDVARFPLLTQSLEARNKRRMGLGVTGLANAVEALGFAYGSADFVAMERRILNALRIAAYEASVKLAQERGAFPSFDAELYGQGKFIQQLPADLQKDIARYGIRNSHLTSVAPTGTISLCADNVSSGIEPVFALEQRRTVHLPAGDETESLQDYGWARWGTKAHTAEEVTVQEHLDVFCGASELVDSAVSKTVNVGGGVGWDEFKSVYTQAWQRGAKGCTTFRAQGKRFGVIQAVEPAEPSCQWDPATGRKSCE